MNAEVEALAVDAFGGRARPRHGPTRPPGSPCANCGAILQGGWCHACGQLAEDFHRSIGRLATEVVEGVTHLDGRLWRTLPGLILRPAKLTRAYIDGHRAAQIPPLRLFLVVLLLVFLASSIGGDKTVFINTGGQPVDRAAAETKMKDVHVSFGGHEWRAATEWTKARVTAALSDPARFKLILESQAERFAFMALPIATILLTLLFVFQRRFFVFDHTIFALHSLSFQGLLLALLSVVQAIWEPLAAFVLLAAPVHLFFHMRGFYETSIAGTILRMTLLGLASGVAFIFLLILLVIVGLSGMGS